MPLSPRIAVVTAITLATTAVGPVPATAASPTPAKSPASAQEITLITGDVVALTPAGGGKFTASVRPAAGREAVGFQTIETDHGVRVIPADAIPLLAAGRVDAALFDVQRLLRDGYGDAAGPTLPLIVQGGAASALGGSALGGSALDGSAADGSALRGSALRGSAATTLASIGAVAVKAGKGQLADFWKAQAGTAATGRSAATGRIWLDRRVSASLAESTAQIGAPAAWQAGLDGGGVKVAVLDTGIDASHPDVAGQVAAAQDFSGSGDTVDRFGHGTHVAATVAGTGNASGGREKGVAPGAKLLIGKVLDDAGNGYESSIIEGMQWAVDSGARVVNMSLGGEPTDGTDPMAAAVDALSARTGALFVVAAGNEGATSTVGTPGSAPAALTVGAVDKANKLTGFSSRGPRVGDSGLKPEITAPGVDIVAARAAGTTMGEPVDARYTAASGTSMATPHVAGAAAILAGQHPDWTGARIKDALVSTAATQSDVNVYGQGAGRVDLARAVSQKVSGTGVADFGEHQAGSSPSVVTRTVTYANSGASPVTLSLDENLAAVSVPAQVTVPAGETASVAVSLDTVAAARGPLSGWLTATAAGGVQVTTALGAMLDGRHHKVTFTAVDRAGGPASVPGLQLFGDDARFDVLNFLFVGETKTFELQEGDYLLDATIEDGGSLDEQVTQVVNPELRVDRDLTVVLDARKGRPIRIETPRPSEQRTVLSYYVHRVTGSGRGIANGFMFFSTLKQVNVTPTAPLRAGSFEFSSRWQLVAPIAVAQFPAKLTLDLLPSSPVYDGTRRFGLAAGLGGSVRGKAVVLDEETDDDEYGQVQAAADAGAAAVIFVRKADRSGWSPWSPDGERLAIPAAVLPYDQGQALLASAARRGNISLTLTPNSPYLYDVFQVSAGRVPSQIVHKVTAANSYRITSRYADNGGFDWVREQRFGWRPWQAYSWNDTQRDVRTPTVREEWVSTGDTIWQHQVHHAYPWNDLGASLDGGMADVPVSYRRPGASSETWNSPVVRPATPAGWTNTRTGDVLHLRIADYVDATDRHHTVDQADRASASLYRDGALVTTTPNAWQDVTVPPGDARYRLTLSTARGGDDWQYGTSTSTEWTFRSAKAGPLPLLQVGYSAPVSLDGTATTRAHAVRVTVPGATRMTVEYSANEGATWTRVPGSCIPGSCIPAGKGAVSLRVTASDRAGNTVRQTVIRAYGRS
ncbi:S8 family serine peptidase [Actinoplanes sp. NPDC051513]|uniref:S8 family serine peptidase n=1 Tax=Actinoplanes sp. NPDC051513 TaxID=3363908 RepID=UPI0037A3DC8E